MHVFYFSKVEINGFIYNKTPWEHFNRFLSEEEFRLDFKIKWILLNPKGETHQQALRDFFEAVLGKGNIPSSKRINDYFTDKDGNPIKFSKPHGNSNYLKEFEDILKQ